MDLTVEEAERQIEELQRHIVSKKKKESTFDPTNIYVEVEDGVAWLRHRTMHGIDWCLAYLSDTGLHCCYGLPNTLGIELKSGHLKINE